MMLLQTLGFPPETVLLILAVCLPAYFLKGLSGFGPGLLFVPTIGLLFGPRTALVSSAFVDSFVGLGMLLSLRYTREDWFLIGRMVSFMAMGSVVGSSLAGFMPASVVLGLIGLFVAVSGVSFVIWDRPLPPAWLRSRVLKLWSVCLMGGVTGGLVGISGPLIIPVLRPMMDRSRFRRVLVAFFLCEGILRLIIYRMVGMWTADMFRITALAAPAVIVGLLLGYRAHLNITERRFNVVVGAVLIVIAVRIGWGLMG
jgi:uncharacterized membrane protein YfcA